VIRLGAVPQPTLLGSLGLDTVTHRSLSVMMRAVGEASAAPTLSSCKSAVMLACANDDGGEGDDDDEDTGAAILPSLATCVDVWWWWWAGSVFECYCGVCVMDDDDDTLREILAGRINQFRIRTFPTVRPGPIRAKCLKLVDPKHQHGSRSVLRTPGPWGGGIDSAAAASGGRALK
jgi:hypothetical protein